MARVDSEFHTSDITLIELNEEKEIKKQRLHNKNVRITGHYVHVLCIKRY